jgi:hypothetical protein
MSKHRFVVSGLCVAVCLGVVVFARAQTAPPRWDDAAARVYVAQERIPNSDPERYAWYTSLLGRIGGTHDNGDVLVIKLKEGTRVLGEKRCPLQFRGEGGGGAGSFQCRLDEIKTDHAGDFVYDLTYEAANGTTTQLRPLAFTIAAYSYMIDRTTRKHTAQYLLAGHDLLGSSIVRLDGRPAQWSTTVVEENGQYFEVPYRQSNFSIRFWSTHMPLSLTSDVQLRCSVNGSPVTMETGGSLQLRPETNYYGDDRRSNGNEVAEQRWGWNTWDLSTRWFVVEKGERRALPPVAPGQRRNANGLPAVRDITSLPGTWDCTLRTGGQEVRRFVFRVTPNGLERNPSAEVENGLFVGEDAYFAETYFPTGAQQFDRNLLPDAIRRTGFYGRPWGTTLDMMGQLPNAFGDRQPAAVQGARGGGGGGARRR